MTEASASFPCFGSHCAVFVTGSGHAGTADEAVAWARDQLLRWHEKFTRFDESSELSQLNTSPAHAVRVSPEMARFVQVVQQAGTLTQGLVDATLLGEIEAAGYTTDLAEPAPLTTALATAPERHPAAPNPASRWRMLSVSPDASLVIRPPGLRLDSGGLAKGLFCDLLAERLETHAAFAVDCAGDVRVGGTAGIARPIQVASPFEDRVLHTFEDSSIAAATSGIGRRAWLGGDGEPFHHLLDPATGRPAFTGVVQATALAPTAALAEICAKAAVLSGPDAAASWLPLGGLVVCDDGSYEVVE